MKQEAHKDSTHTFSLRERAGAETGPAILSLRRLPIVLSVAGILILVFASIFYFGEEAENARQSCTDCSPVRGVEDGGVSPDAGEADLVAPDAAAGTAPPESGPEPAEAEARDIQQMIERADSLIEEIGLPADFDDRPPHEEVRAALEDIQKRLDSINTSPTYGGAQ